MPAQVKIQYTHNTGDLFEVRMSLSTAVDLSNGLARLRMGQPRGRR